jgi:chemotaxis protein MotB
MIIPAILATPSGGVLVASPNSSLREQVRHSFYEHRWPVQEVMGGADALLKLETGNWQLLYSTSQVDKKKVGHLALAIQVAFQELGVFPGSNTRVPLDMKGSMPLSDVQAVETAHQVAAIGRIVTPTTGSLSGREEPGTATEEKGDLDSLRQELEHALVREISRKEVALRTVPDGLVISLREIGFFESGSADIKSSSQPAFNRIVSLLSQRKSRIRIEGHTDDVPIHNSRFNSNWELSTTRATVLVRLLMLKYQIAPERLSAAGYAAYHPVALNDTAEGRAQNRRVDVVVLGRPAPPR